MPDIQLSGAQAITALVPILTPFVVWGAKILIGKLPRVSLPVIALGAGMALDWLLAYISGGTWSPVMGAVMGGLGVWAREIVHTLKEHGLSA